MLTPKASQNSRNHVATFDERHTEASDYDYWSLNQKTATSLGRILGNRIWGAESTVTNAFTLARKQGHCFRNITPVAQAQSQSTVATEATSHTCTSDTHADYFPPDPPRYNRQRWPWFWAPVGSVLYLLWSELPLLILDPVLANDEPSQLLTHVIRRRLYIIWASMFSIWLLSFSLTVGFPLCTAANAIAASAMIGSGVPKLGWVSLWQAYFNRVVAGCLQSDAVTCVVILQYIYLLLKLFSNLDFLKFHDKVGGICGTEGCEACDMEHRKSIREFL